MRGKFITIEGQDGAGKSTNIAVVSEFLQQHKVEFVQTREPGGTEFGEQIRSLMLSAGDQSFGDMAELLLMFAARAEHLRQVITPALESGKWVLCDRFTDASYAYQGAGRNMGDSAITTLEQLVQDDLRPDLTLLLDLPVEVGESRAGQRSQPDRFEQQKLDFKQRVRDAYLQRAEDQPERIKTIDASQTIEQVRQQIISTLRGFV